MVTNRLIENAHKFAFVVKHYDELTKRFPELVENFPDNQLQQILSVFTMPSIDVNAAIWKAAELELTTLPDKDSGQVSFIKTPETWVLGDNVDTLANTLSYAFNQLGERESDLEEQMVNDWLMGYIGHDAFIALNLLLDNHVLATYELTDPKDLKSTYTFYTSYENSEQMWGRKMFKEQPTGEEKPEVGEDENQSN